MLDLSLTPKRRQFIAEYLIDQNPTQAAIRAGYSKKRAHITGSGLLKEPAVAAAIADRQQQISDRVQITVEDVINGLYEEATFRGEGSAHSARVTAWTAIGKAIGAFGGNKGSADTTPAERLAQARERAEAAARAQREYTRAVQSGKVVEIDRKAG